MLSLVSFAGMTLNKCAVLWIGTLTGGPVQGESPPVLVKESHIQTYSRTSVCGHTYLSIVYIGFYLFGPQFDLYQSLGRLPISNSQNCSVSSGFHCRVITGSLMRLY